MEREANLHQTQEDADKRAKEVSSAWEKASAQAKDSTDRALDRMSDVAQAFARNQSGQPVITTPQAGGPQVVYPGGQVSSPGGQPTVGETKVCPSCGRFVPAESHHCTYCGHKFEGV